MSVLVVAHESPLPARGGGARRVLHTARELAHHLDDDVTVVALGPAPRAEGEPFDLVGVPHHVARLTTFAKAVRRPYLEVWSRSPALVERIRRTRWDLAVATSAFVVPAALESGAPVLLDTHNVEHEIAASLARAAPGRLAAARWRWEAGKIRRFERTVAREVDVVTAPSAQDAAAYRELGARSVEVAPNGVAVAEVPWQPPAPGSRLGYVGQYGYLPNELAGRELVQEVLPLVQATVPDASVRLVGRAPTPALEALAAADVEVTGEVDDVLASLRDVRALVVPLRAGSGTRLKILEAFAAGVPVVSTPLGAAGLDVEPGRHLLLGESPRELAEAAIRVVGDDELAGSLSRRARALAADRYDWSRTLQPLVERCRALLAEGARP